MYLFKTLQLKLKTFLLITKIFLFFLKINKKNLFYIKIIFSPVNFGGMTGRGPVVILKH
jgi:hypothetical protein